MKDPIKHHYVPQSILKKFSINNKEKQIYVFDKIQNKSFPSSIRDAGSENNFNSYNDCEEKIIFESTFQNNDDLVAFLTNKINNEKNLNFLSERDKDNLINTVAVQLIRTKMYRTTLYSLSKQLSTIKKEMNINSLHKDNIFPTLSEDEIRKIAHDLMLDYGEITSGLKDKIMLLIENVDTNPFWISDNPITQYNSFPYGERGINSPGIQIYFPISPTLTLGFYCPTILKKIITILNFHKNDRRYNDFRIMNDGILNGVPITLGAQTVTFLNSLQITNSSRFIYSSISDFSLASDIIKKNSSISNVSTLINVGEIGKGPELKKRMPKGVWSVVYTKTDHFMIPVINWKSISGLLEFETNDFIILDAVMKDLPIKQLILFKDGNELRGMRDVKFEIYTKKDIAYVQVKHQNDTLNEILSKLIK